MKKHLLTLTCTCCLLFFTKMSFAQTSQDGLMMTKKEVCLVLNYDRESWNKYWEGDRLRDNPNIGTLSTRMVSFMAAYGLTEKLNVFAVLPYIENEASAGTMTGLKGVQDLSLAAKYNFFNYAKLKLFGVVGVSVPTNNYVPDFLPFSIGLHSKTASARIIAHQLLPYGIHVTAQVGYIARSKTNVDRTNYYTGNEIEYSHEMAVPDQVSSSLRIGINKKAVLAEAFIDNIASTSGTDIRRYDMPLPANKMNWTRVGVFVTWHTPIDYFSVNGHFSHVVAGRNVGDVEVSYGAQLQYVLDFRKKK